MEKALLAILLGFFILRAMIEDLIDKAFPNFTMRTIIALILIVWGLYRLKQKKGKISFKLK